jgi:GNAT superfamily N-acetyltransferase
MQIVSGAAVEFFNIKTAALRSLATDEPFKKQGYGSIMMELLEKWIRILGGKAIQLHADLKTESFYRKLGYVAMLFNDQ